MEIQWLDYSADNKMRHGCQKLYVGNLNNGRSHAPLIKLGNDGVWYMDTEKRSGNYWVPIEGVTTFEEAKVVVEMIVRME